ncbi:LysE family translocator [Clostridium felsineum]|uniref:Uncharacterized protein n=1 Tax=Clostridium felsineum TaxID=36839 RepID=A0A1S8KXJ9_9CLOT|nr:LysE family transporter [Clostridium felsineum]URZ09144.1 hypothetical protein CLROS_045600 [Clostridium felsineum]URZ13831.1 hypothetical protein CROST_046090 [Clostridium felsineum]
MLHIFFKGLITGLIIGMPLGPIGAICLKLALTRGVSFGFAAGLGSCLVDSFYVLVGSTGITFVYKFFNLHRHSFKLFGGILLLMFGVKFILSKKEASTEISNGKTLLKSFLSTFIIALANPTAIFSTIFIFASFGTKHLNTMFSKLTLILGVFCGSLLWIIMIIMSTKKFNKSMTSHKISIINKAVGILIMGFGIVFVISSFKL